MSEKYVKDKAHNRHRAYCCDDIDERVGALEEAVAALVAGTVPDGSVTLAKLAGDARTYTREINRGLLFAEWVGTQQEYEEHVSANGGEPLANVKYIITGGNYLSDLVVVKETYDDTMTQLMSGVTQQNLYIAADENNKKFWGYARRTQEELAIDQNTSVFLESPHAYVLTGTWQRIGVVYEYVDKSEATFMTLWQRIKP